MKDTIKLNAQGFVRLSDIKDTDENKLYGIIDSRPTWFIDKIG